MAVDTTHKDYDKFSTQWKKLRDCVAGQDAVHDRGVEYLPKLDGQSQYEYDAYKTRAGFYGATARTVDGLSGMVFRKEPQFEVPNGFVEYLYDMTLDGTNVQSFAEELVDDVITIGRSGILVDYPSVAPETTVAQAERLNLRPFVKRYSAESILNWRVETINNAQVLTQLKLREWVNEVDPNDEFSEKWKKQIRVLDLIDGQYRQRVFIKNESANTPDDEWVQLGDDVFPLMNGAPLDVIPFFFCGVKGGTPDVDKPPLIDLANTNLSHYRSTADLEHGAHFTALPTAVISGHVDDPDDAAEFRIGSATAWIFPNSETRAEFLEFQGQGLEALEKRVMKKEEYMAFLGARMLSPDKRGVEAAETAQIHRTGEISVLASLTHSVSQSIEKALEFMTRWAGFEGDVMFRLNTDFTAAPMTPQEMTALMQLWQSGAIAFSDLLENLQRGEIVRPDRTEDELRSEIEIQNPFTSEDLTNEPPVQD